MSEHSETTKARGEDDILGVTGKVYSKQCSYSFTVHTLSHCLTMCWADVSIFVLDSSTLKMTIGVLRNAAYRKG